MVRGTVGKLWGFDARSRRLFAGATAIAASLLLATGDTRTSPPAPPELIVDANEAPSEVLMAIPRIGPVLAGRIVAEREARRFRSLADLDARVRGIGPATAAAVRPHLRFAPPNVPASP